MKTFSRARFVTIAILLSAALQIPAATVWLDDLDLSKTIQDWSNAQKK